MKRTMPAEVMHAVLIRIAERDGMVAAGIAAESYLDGIVAALRQLVGPEAAYNAMQRRADGAARPLIWPRARSMEARDGRPA